MLYYLFMTCFAKKQEPVKNMGDVTTLGAFSYLRISDRDLVRKATSNWFLPSLIVQAYYIRKRNQKSNEDRDFYNVKILKPKYAQSNSIGPKFGFTSR